ncbi:MAG TPA: ATP-dependent DNA helicase RecG [Solirubrobacteraceae bacterium]|nr:ATP-dependent DNA helicase RecG [Solirubrobacteraceae bacterium]
MPSAVTATARLALDLAPDAAPHLAAPGAPAPRDAADVAQPPYAFASSARLSTAQLLTAPVRRPRPERLRAPLDGVSGKLADGLASLGLHTIGALLEHLPRDRREARTIATLKPGEQATVAVEIRSISARPVRRRGMRPLVEARVFDETGSMRATFFNQPWLVQRYPPGTRLVLHGKAQPGQRFSVAHHAVGAELGAGEPDVVAHYPATEGVTSTQILALVQSARDSLADLPEALTARVRVEEGLPDRASALAALHFPANPQELEAGRARLAFEELLLTQLVFLRRRARRSELADAPELADPPSLSARWLERCLPFALTGDQRAAIATIAEDLARPLAMQRLLMGEVGSGKTVVALYAMLRAVEHSQQAVLMAPTETLAEQHFATVQRLIGDEPLTSALLTGSTPARRRADILGKLASGELSLIVGTHALIEPDVRFRSLALAVIDEQHRFGVRQRAALLEQGQSPQQTQSPQQAHAPPQQARAPHPAQTPHVLHMTATPIPRTLALARYGDLDVSTLRELPSARQPIDTRILAGDMAREQAYLDLRAQLDAGRQAFVVCPLIEESTANATSAASAAGMADVRAATAEFERLAKSELHGYELVLLHGGMRPREKQEAMAAFASGAAQVLVATTVIEVGIDVPNATVMLVENAARFGISQLHQLRGRIGRGEHRSTCLLVGSPASPRLRALVEHADGFRLAEIDLELRNEGELVGVRQSGLSQFEVACLPDDAELLERARVCAHAIVAADPELAACEHALLGELLDDKYGAQALEPIPA